MNIRENWWLLRNRFLKRLAVACLLLGGTLGANLKSDEFVLIFPTYGYRSPDGESWHVRIHAWVFEPEENSLKRRALLNLFAKKMGIADDEMRSSILQRRAKPFLYDNESGKSFSIHLGDQRFEIGPSSANGHISTEITLPNAVVDKFGRESNRPGQRELAFRADVPSALDGAEHFAIPCLDPEGVSVITDFDDTIKVSDVTDRKALIRNTFTNEFSPVEGMSDLFRLWAESGATFHYVSASPWQLLTDIRRFLAEFKFPEGSISLKTFRWKDSSFFDLFAKSDEIKRPFFEEILKSFPKRKFILIGDSGEADAEVYAALAEAFPDQIQRIFIRVHGQSSLNQKRWELVFGKLPREKWTLFTHPSELKDVSLRGDIRPVTA